MDPLSTVISVVAGLIVVCIVLVVRDTYTPQQSPKPHRCSFTSVPATVQQITRLATLGYENPSWVHQTPDGFCQCGRLALALEERIVSLEKDDKRKQEMAQRLEAGRARVQAGLPANEPKTEISGALSVASSGELSLTPENIVGMVET